ncbi:MAG: ATP-binding protein [Lachnospiraceae bacterium]|nr:ATP-binding protein [Lachnospiraceae bacterium]
MRQNINNFAKIEKADIIIDGITVIAGENNTGKSTIGKILFSIFNSLCNIEDKILKERLKEVEVSNRMILQNYVNVSELSRSIIAKNILNVSTKIRQQLKKYIDNNDSSLMEEDIHSILETEVEEIVSFVRMMNVEDSEKMMDELVQNICEILSMPEDKIVSEILTRYFNNVFYTQVKPLNSNVDNETIIDLEIKGKRNSFIWDTKGCKEIVDEINIMHKAIYIDNPFIVDELSEYNFLNPMNEFLKNLLTDTPKENLMDGVIESVRSKEKLSDIYETLQNVVDGEIIINQSNDEFYLKSTGFSEPISFHNLSTGMKSFVILKMLLEKGCLKDKDVVILDEPEIHLHPQWQIAYAELIVLLQKHFDLSVVVTTHSPYFVDAINLFSCKYNTDSKVNYYMSSDVNNIVKMECVTDNIESIYKKMASPIQILNTLRYDLNNH